MIIPRKDVGLVILETLREISRESLPNATEAERELSIASFLGVWSGAMFNAPVEESE